MPPPPKGVLSLDLEVDVAIGFPVVLGQVLGS